MKWYCLILISIFLMTNNIEHLFLYFLDICTSALEECLFKSFACCLIRLLVFLLLKCYILDLYQICDLQVFSPFLEAVFSLPFFPPFLFTYYFWLWWVFIATCKLSLVAVTRGYTLVAVHGLPIAVASLVGEHGL